MNGMLNDTNSLEKKLKTVMTELKDYLANVNGSDISRAMTINNLTPHVINSDISNLSKQLVETNNISTLINVIQHIHNYFKQSIMNVKNNNSMAEYYQTIDTNGLIDIRNELHRIFTEFSQQTMNKDCSVVVKCSLSSLIRAFDIVTADYCDMNKRQNEINRLISLMASRLCQKDKERSCGIVPSPPPPPPPTTPGTPGTPGTPNDPNKCCNCPGNTKNIPVVKALPPMNINKSPNEVGGKY